MHSALFFLLVDIHSAFSTTTHATRKYFFRRQRNFPAYETLFHVTDSNHIHAAMEENKEMFWGLIVKPEKR